MKKIIIGMVVALFSLAIVVESGSAAEKEAVNPEDIKKHALRYLGGEGESVVRVSVVKSYYWQTVKHQCKVCTNPIHHIITIFKVEESYSGKIPEGMKICCFHKRTDTKGLKIGAVYLFSMNVPVGQVRHLDSGELVPVAEISKRWR